MKSLRGSAIGICVITIALHSPVIQAFDNTHCGGEDPIVTELFPRPADCGQVQGAECRRLSIAVASLEDDPITVQIRIHEPLNTELGVVILGTGENGLQWFESNQQAGTGFINQLRNAGYRVVQRAWESDWRNNPNSDAGILATTCRYLGLAHYVEQLVDPAVPVCAVGNSGGAVEIAYALTAHGAGSFIDSAFLDSGPPVGAFELCDDALDPADDSDPGTPVDFSWAGRCMSLLEDLTALHSSDPVEDEFNCDEEDLDRPLCVYPLAQKHGVDRNWGTIEDENLDLVPVDICADYNDPANRSTLLLEHWSSLDTDLWDTGTEDPYVSFLFGDQDCSEAVPGGLALWEVLASNNSTRVELGFVAGAGHNLHSSSLGRLELFNKITSRCPF